MNFSKNSNLFLVLAFSFCSFVSGFCPCGPDGCTMDPMPGGNSYEMDQQRDPYADPMPFDSEFGDPMMQRMDEMPASDPFADDSSMGRSFDEGGEDFSLDNNFDDQSGDMDNRSRFTSSYGMDPYAQSDQAFNEDFGGEDLN